MIAGVADADPAVAQRQLSRFHEYYAEPLLRHLERRFHLDRSSAEDILQEFLVDKLISPQPEHNLTRQYLDKYADTDKVRFRDYLRRALNNRTIDVLRKQHRRPTQSVEMIEDPHETDPGSKDEFDVDWAHNLLEKALERVRADCQDRGQEDIWDVFEARVITPAARNEPPPPYEALTESLGFATPKQASNRLQTAFRKFRTVLRQLIADYLPHDGADQLPQVEAELTELRALLAERGHGRRALDGAAGGDSISAMDPTPLFAGSDDLWGDQDVRGLWHHFISVPLDRYLSEFDPALARTFDEAKIWNGHPLGTLSEVWMHPAPPVELLQAIKAQAKQQGQSGQRVEIRESDGDGLPPCIHGALYLAAIAAARLRWGSHLTRYDDHECLLRVQQMVSAEWLDPSTRELLTEWKRLLESNT